MRRATIGWAIWLLVAAGLFNTGLSHDRLRTLELSMDRGRPVSPLEAVRAYYTNDGDLRRYFAYAQAALGRPYEGYFIRSAEAWRRAFVAHEAYLPDDTPTESPRVRLRPYRDFLVEYPPGFFVLVIPVAIVFTSLAHFILVFQCLMAVALAGALVLGARAVIVARGASKSSTAGAWAALAVFLIGVVATHRFDAVVALALSVACWALVSDRPIVLGLAVGTAVALKLVPIVAVPPLAAVWLFEGRRREICVALGAAGIVIIAAFLPVLVTAGRAVLETARYHIDRPVQIESTWGALLGLIGTVRPGLVVVEKTYGSTNVGGAFGAKMGQISTLTTIVGLAATYVLTWRRVAGGPEGARRISALHGVVAALATFMALGKVFSPQYLTWLLPLGLFLSLGAAHRGALLGFLSVLTMTQLIYPVSYHSLESLRPWALSLVLLRNLMLLAWAWSLTRPDAVTPRLRDSTGTAFST